MKPPTVLLGEMTNAEVEAFLSAHQTVIVPTGAVEQRGPHGPLLTDVLIPQEIARRATAEKGKRFLAAGVRSTIACLENIEAAFRAMPTR